MTEQQQNIVSIAEWKAANFVCASARNPKTGKYEPIGFEFAIRFRGHPWVEASEREGWAKELRSHLRHTVKRRILEGKPYDVIEDLMPDKAWIEAARKQAERYAAAAAYRDQQQPPASAQNLDAAVRRIFKRMSGDAAE